MLNVILERDNMYFLLEIILFECTAKIWFDTFNSIKIISHHFIPVHGDGGNSSFTLITCLINI